MFRRLSLLLALAFVLGLFAPNVAFAAQSGNGRGRHQTVTPADLALPVAAGSLLLLFGGRRWRGGPAIGVVAAVGLVTAVVGVGPLGERFLQTRSSAESRAHMIRTSMSAAIEYAPVGSGFGSFREVYPRFEQSSQVTPTIVNHAHNDYLELALETGIGGIVAAQEGLDGAEPVHEGHRDERQLVGLALGERSPHCLRRGANGDPVLGDDVVRPRLDIRGGHSRSGLDRSRCGGRP